MPDAILVHQDGTLEALYFLSAQRSCPWQQMENGPEYLQRTMRQACVDDIARAISERKLIALEGKRITTTETPAGWSIQVDQPVVSLAPLVGTLEAS